MSTWPEARAAKEQRQQRERRHFTRDLLGPICPTCNSRVPLVLGTNTHPACDPSMPSLLAAAAARAAS